MDDGRLFARILLMGMLVSGAISLLIIVAVVWIGLDADRDVPDVLENWGGIILGFWFGSFFGLMKDYAARPMTKVVQDAATVESVSEELPPSPP